MNQPDKSDVIEILPVSLLDERRPTVEALRKLAGSLRLEFGWHYLLDLTWILSKLSAKPGQRIMDAGAGTGLMQWYLAEQGVEVLSVDRMSRANLPLRFRRRYRVSGLRQSPQPDLLPTRKAFTNNLSGGRLLSQGRELVGYLTSGHAAGSVMIYNQDLMTLTDIANDSLDAVVAVSALEHNTPDGLRAVVQELLRVIKPGGLLLATLGAARDQDWFHEPSAGWCYSEATLRTIFDLPDSTPSNYGRYDGLLLALGECAELSDNLARFYFASGDNGMPWGKWDPQYQPVGVCKVKASG